MRPWPGPRRLHIALADIRYARGLTTFLDVLVIDASLYAAQTERSESESAPRLSLLALCKALGGGWKAATAHSQGDPAAPHGRSPG